MTPFERLLVALPVTLLVACGGSTRGDGPNSDSPSLAPENVAARYANAFCELTSRCCDFSGGEPRTAECEADKLAEQRADADAAARSGALFDQQAAESCFARLANRSCAPDPKVLADHFLPSCSFWRGQVPLGEACEVELDCLREGDVAVRCLEGECRQFQALFPGESCDPQSTTVVCGLGKCDPETLLCVELPYPGDACIDECGFGATCKAGVCELPPVAGSPCTTGSECPNGLCDEGYCASLLIGDHCAVPE